MVENYDTRRVTEAKDIAKQMLHCSFRNKCAERFTLASKTRVQLGRIPPPVLMSAFFFNILVYYYAVYG